MSEVTSLALRKK